MTSNVSSSVQADFFYPDMIYFFCNNILQKYVTEKVLTQAKKQLLLTSIALSILNEFEVYLPAIWLFVNLGVRISNITGGNIYFYFFTTNKTEK